MQRATSSIDVARIGISGYEAPGSGAAGDFGRAATFLGVSPGGNRTLQFNQTNHYTAHGGNSDDMIKGMADAHEANNQKLTDTASVYQW